MYHHRQRGTLLRWVLISTASVLAVVAAIGSFGPDAGAARIVILFTLAVLIAAAFAFHSLTISIENGVLTWSFGPGIFRKSVSISEIAEVSATRTSILEGWGIHLTARGWLYNVSGRDAVWVRLRSRKQFLLGTDEPIALIEAIRSA